MDKEIKISFPEAKLEALEFFLREENETVERVMKSYLDKVYDKTVPSQVRKFVDSRIGAQESTAAQNEQVETAGIVQDVNGNDAQTNTEQTAQTVQDSHGAASHSHNGDGAQEDGEQGQTAGNTQTGAGGRGTTRTSTRRNSRRNTTGENQMQEAADRPADGTSETQETDQTGEQEEEPVGGMMMGM